MKKLAPLASSLVLVSLVAGVGCAAPQEISEEKGESSELILGGSEDSGHAAIAIVRAVTSPTTLSLCTGSLIKSNIMITAAHCAFNDGKPLTKVDVSFSSRPNIGLPLGDKAWVAGRIIPNPAWNGNDGTRGGEDVAVIVLDRDVNITPMKLAKAPAAGATVTAVGFGWNDHVSSGDQIKRQVAIPVTQVTAHEIAAGKDNLGTCHGDSGGPLLLNDKIVGIVSYGDTADCHGVSHFTRADDVADFIQAVIASADGEGDDPPAPAPGATPPKTTNCSVSISCVNGACTCGSGANKGKACEGKLGSASSCSNICSTCTQ